MEEILKRLEAHRLSESGLAWEGSFADYLKLVAKQPAIAQFSHARIYQMIVAQGVTSTNDVRRYTVFEQELFGLDRALGRLVEEYLHPAARRLDVRKRILLLMGPVSGGKSTLVTMLKR